MTRCEHRLKPNAPCERRWQLLRPQLIRFRFGGSDDLLIKLVNEEFWRLVLEWLRCAFACRLAGRLTCSCAPVRALRRMRRWPSARCMPDCGRSSFVRTCNTSSVSTAKGHQVSVQRNSADYSNFAYSALACFRMGMSGSASFQRTRDLRLRFLEQNYDSFRVFAHDRELLPIRRPVE